jgi:hypothetical protein
MLEFKCGSNEHANQRADAKMPKGRNWVMRDPRMSSGVPITKASFDRVIVLPACTGYSA